MNSAMVRVPAMALVTMPSANATCISCGIASLCFSRSHASLAAAPRIIGVERRNENRAAVGRSRLRSKPAEIVMPLRETPGTIDRIWKKPTNRESDIETWPSFLCSRAERSAHHRKRPIKMALAPIIGRVLRFVSACFSSARPGDPSGQRSQNQIPKQHRIAAQLRIPADCLELEAVEDDLDPIPEEVNEHGRQGSDVERDIVSQAGVGPAEKLRNHHKVRRTADRKELGETLNDAEYNDF